EVGPRVGGGAEVDLCCHVEPGVRGVPPAEAGVGPLDMQERDPCRALGPGLGAPSSLCGRRWGDSQEVGKLGRGGVGGGARGAGEGTHRALLVVVAVQRRAAARASRRPMGTDSRGNWSSNQRIPLAGLPANETVRSTRPATVIASKDIAA